MTIPPALIGFFAAIFVVVVLYRIVVEASLLRSRRAQTFARVSGSARAAPEGAAPAKGTLADQLRTAGLDLGANAETTFHLVCLTLGLLAAAGVLVMGFPFLVAVVAGAAAFYYPRRWLATQARKRALEIDRELPGALGDLIAILRVVPALDTALDQVTAQLRIVNPKSPLADELAGTLADWRSQGGPGAFRALASRTASPALSMLAFALAVFVQTGGEYFDALEAQARGVRQVLEARGTAQAAAADAMLSVKAIPIILFGVSLFLMQDPFFHAFYFSFAGQVLILIAISAMFIGYQLVQSMVGEAA